MCWLKMGSKFFWVISTVAYYKQVTVILAVEWNEGLETFGMLFKTLSLNNYFFLDGLDIGHSRRMGIVRFWGMVKLQGSVAEWPKLHSRKQPFGPLVGNQPRVCREGIIQEGGVGVSIMLSNITKSLCGDVQCMWTVVTQLLWVSCSNVQPNQLDKIPAGSLSENTVQAALKAASPPLCLGFVQNLVCLLGYVIFFWTHPLKYLTLRTVLNFLSVPNFLILNVLVATLWWEVLTEGKYGCYSFAFVLKYLGYASLITNFSSSGISR